MAVIKQIDGTTREKVNSIDLYELYEESWEDGSIILAFPNIPLSAMEALKEQARTLANAESLDLDVIIVTEIENDQPKETDRWRLGWDDSRQVFIQLFPQEFFQKEGAPAVYEEWVKMYQDS